MTRPSAKFVTRFAPSPTGFLHLGHAFSAMSAYRAAQKQDGEFILRLEDIDQTRCRPNYIDAIYEDLHWLGLRWSSPVRLQSEHMDNYDNILTQLRRKGLVYRCFKTRKEILEAMASAPHHAGTAPLGTPFWGAPLPQDEERRQIEKGKAYAWRLSIQAAREFLGQRFESLFFIEEGHGPQGERGRIQATPEIFGDVVIARKDAGTSYHLAVVHDDALQNITHIIRGEDLFHASHLHLLLQELLELPKPTYRHHHLITDDNGKKFSKRDQSVTLRQLRQAGHRPQDILERLGL
ncbi:MAG: tRNA glutamyl-Q(34) synthetase GluQRS [bacterium]